jgi:hypothetical protein
VRTRAAVVPGGSPERVEILFEPDFLEFIPVDVSKTARFIDHPGVFL